MRRIEDLHPKLQDLIYDLKAECEKQGLKIGISECLRTKEEQDKLYAKGRTEKGSVVTNARGSTYSSMHQWGIAFDFYRNDGKELYYKADGFFRKVGAIGKSIGLQWGGDFKSPVDEPHFQLPDWGSTPAKLKAEYKTPENFFKTWEETAMTVQEQQKFNALVGQVEKMTKSIEQATMVYNYFDENFPEWAKETVQKAVDKGIVKGTENGLGLTMQDIKALCFMERLGIL